MPTPDRKPVFCGPDPDHGEFVDPIESCRTCPQTCERDIFLPPETVLYLAEEVVGLPDTQQIAVVNGNGLQARSLWENEKARAVIIVDKEGKGVKHSPSQVLYLAKPPV